MSFTPKSLPKDAGVSLIEVLVAIVIFSFGMLGLAGLQTRLMTYSQSSLMRSQAMALTDDVLDRMRVDRQNAVAGNWNTNLDDAAASLPNGTNAYEFDLRGWKTEVETLLPAGRASILVDAAQNNLVTVTVEWNDSRGTDAANTEDGLERFVTRSRL
ncbi:MAG TPA: type IV pilus modification protein PilV [Rhizobacter sp.]